MIESGEVLAASTASGCRGRWGVGLLAVVATALLASPAAAQPLLRLGPSTPQDAAVVTAAATTGGAVWGAEVDLDLIRTGPERLELLTLEGDVFEAELSRFEERGSGNVLWVGRIAGADHDSVQLTLQDGYLVGWYQLPHGMQFEVRARPDGSGRVVRPGTEVRPLCGVNEPHLHRTPSEDVRGSVSLDREPGHRAHRQAAGTKELSVLMMVTPRLVREWVHEQRGNLDAEVRALYDYANQVFVNNGVGVRIVAPASARRADGAPLPVWAPLTLLNDGELESPGGSDYTAPWGTRLDVERMRSLYGADLVHLLYWNPDLMRYCGVAQGVWGTKEDGTQETAQEASLAAYQQTNMHCWGNLAIFVHEIGHSLGGWHDGINGGAMRCFAEGGNSSPNPYTGNYYAYSCSAYGALLGPPNNPGSSGTIMAYARSREPFFSSVRLDKGGPIAGFPHRTADLEAVLKVTAPLAADFDTWLPPRPPEMTATRHVDGESILVSSAGGGHGTYEVLYTDNHAAGVPTYAREFDAEHGEWRSLYRWDSAPGDHFVRVGGSALMDRSFDRASWNGLILCKEDATGTRLACSEPSSLDGHPGWSWRPGTEPRRVVPTPWGGGIVEVTWDDNSNSEDYYKVQVRAPGYSDWRDPGLAVAPHAHSVARIPGSALGKGGSVLWALDEVGQGRGRTLEFRVCAGRLWAADNCSAAVALERERIHGGLPTPTNVSASSRDLSTVRVTWLDHAATETGYEIEHRLFGSGGWTRAGTVAANGTAFDVGNLSSETTYEFRVRALGNTPSEWSSTATATTGVFRAPTGLTGAVLSVSEVQLGWSDNSATETGFEIEYRSGANVWQPAGTTAANVATFEVGNLSSGTTYEFRVRALQGGSEPPSEWSGTVTVTTQVFGPPTNLSGAVRGVDGVGLAWTDNAATETGFEIEYRLVGSIAWLQAGTVAANYTTFEVGGLSSMGSYEFRVRALQGGNQPPSEWSNTVTVGTEAFAAPSHLRGVALGPTSVRLSWVDNSATEVGFEIEYRTSGANAWRQWGIVGANVTTWDLGNLALGTTYYFRVRARQGGGQPHSGWSNTASVTTDVAVPTAPTNLSGTALGPDSVRLTWTDNSSTETGFEVDYQISATGSWTRAGTVAADVTTFDVLNLSSGTTYEFRVRALQGSGQPPSSWTNVVSVLLPSRLVAPTDLRVRGGSWPVGTLAFAWKDNSAEESGYRFEFAVHPDGGFAAAATYTRNATSAVVSGLVPDRYYRFRVVATGPGQEAASDEVIARSTLPPEPGQVPNCHLNQVVTTLGENGRFEVRMCLEYPNGSQTDAFDYRLAARDSGLLFFFDRDNAEVLLKVLDFCSYTGPYGGNYWVFAAPVTTLGFRLHVKDSQTGMSALFQNSAATTADSGVRYTSLPCSGTAAGAAVTEVPGTRALPPDAALVTPVWLTNSIDAASAGAVATCTRRSTGLTLKGGYRVSACWEHTDGSSGTALNWRLDSEQSGILYFFERNNAEVLLKVLDGCRVNGHRWVFVAPVTDLGLRLRVTSPDGSSWDYTSAVGEKARSRSDTAAFACR